MENKLDRNGTPTGCVFNIQNYSVHDGPGIRTIVFLKGCPLRCTWCCNPESQKVEPEMAYNANKCIGVKECGACIAVCTNGACGIGGDGKSTSARQRCTECLKCTQVCPAKARTAFGKYWTVDDILRVVESEEAFYDTSGGGVTLSGGESLQQIEFAVAMLKEAKERRIDTAIETCGCVPWEHFAQAAPYIDHILYDIKCIDREKHRQFTGADNDLILENFKKLRTLFPDKDVLARTPVVPGFNDTKEEIAAIVKFLKQFPEARHELLPYHRMGQPKYEYLGREFLCKEVMLDESKMAELQAMAEDMLKN